MIKKLYRIIFQGSLPNVYVVATDPQEAYITVRKDLDKNDYGFRKDRVMKAIELLAEDALYPECEIRLYISDSKPLYTYPELRSGKEELRQKVSDGTP